MVNDLYSRIDICVLIPCYNNIEGLIKSVQSIQYNHQHLLILVVDDGSTIPVAKNFLYQHLPVSVNIQLIRLDQNQGITRALNKGLDFVYASYPASYIARLDCGDICSPERFYTQVSFLETHTDIDLLGTWCYFKNYDSGLAYEYITPAVHALIKRSMYFRNVFVHPTVMWRVSTLQSYRYPEIYPHAEDYGLFYDILVKRKTAILQEFLVTCEINKGGISFKNRTAQLKSRLRVICDFGTNKLLLAAGIVKLTILMMLPYRLINWVKRQLYKYQLERDSKH